MEKFLQFKMDDNHIVLKNECFCCGLRTGLIFWWCGVGAFGFYNLYIYPRPISVLGFVIECFELIVALGMIAAVSKEIPRAIKVLVQLKVILTVISVIVSISHADSLIENIMANPSGPDHDTFTIISRLFFCGAIILELLASIIPVYFLRKYWIYLENFQAAASKKPDIVFRS